MDESWNVLRGNHRKTASLLQLTVARLVEVYGLDHVGMLTLTFADAVTDAKEAGRRMNSLLTHIIRPRYGDYVCVLERQKNRRIHFHLLVALEPDIRTGIDFAAIVEKDYRSASPALRKEWSFWRRTAKPYGFGRTELLPVKSNAEAISFYVSKYISKHIDSRHEADKGVRLVRTSFKVKAGTTQFGWNTQNFRLWREKHAALAEVIGVGEGETHKALGARWAFKHQDIIQSIKLPEYWSDQAREDDSIPPGLYMSEDVLRFIKETGKYRLTPEEAAIAIGLRTLEGRKQNFRFVYHENPTTTDVPRDDVLSSEDEPDGATNQRGGNGADRGYSREGRANQGPGRQNDSRVDCDEFRGPTGSVRPRGINAPDGEDDRGSRPRAEAAGKRDRSRMAGGDGQPTLFMEV